MRFQCFTILRSILSLPSSNHRHCHRCHKIISHLSGLPLLTDNDFYTYTIQKFVTSAEPRHVKRIAESRTLKVKTPKGCIGAISRNGAKRIFSFDPGAPQVFEQHGSYAKLRRPSCGISRGRNVRISCVACSAQSCLFGPILLDAACKRIADLHTPIMTCAMVTSLSLSVSLSLLFT